MNTARDLLAELQSMGIELRAVANKIKVRAPAGKVTMAVLDRLAAAKPELLKLLATNKKQLPHVWHFLIDGKRVTAIDHERQSEAEFMKFLQRKFGAARVSGLTLQFNQPGSIDENL